MRGVSRAQADLNHNPSPNPSPSPSPQRDPILSPAQLAHYAENGVLVVPRAQLGLSESDIASAKSQLARTLHDRVGCDAANLADSAGLLAGLSSTSGAGGILDLFYESFQLGLAERPAIAAVVCELWAHSMDSYRDKFDPWTPLAGVDRVCFRVPDTISAKFGRGKCGLQRHLAPHLDRCPHDVAGAEASTKWRPIQCFLSLSDTLGESEGGFEACPGLHRDFASWAQRRAPSVSTGQPAPCVGDFTPMRPVEDADILGRMKHVPCRAGDLVLWDNRIPHANSRRNLAAEPRQVVYLKYLPNVECNRRYVRSQLPNFASHCVPTDFWINPPASPPLALGSEEPAQPPSLDELGRRMFGLAEWREGESVWDYCT